MDYTYTGSTPLRQQEQREHDKGNTKKGNQHINGNANKGNTHNGNAIIMATPIKAPL